MRLARALAVTTLLAGCASSPPVDPSSPAAAPEPGAPAGVTPTAKAEAPADAPAAPSAGAEKAGGEPAPAMKETLAAGSVAAGLAPLTSEERAEVKAKCGSFQEAVGRAAKADKTGKTSIELARQVLANPPVIEGVDVARCGALFLRDLEAYEARTMESEAFAQLKRIMVGMASAFEGEPSRLCPSAPPAPARLADVATGPYTSKGPDWAAEGWRCLRFDMLTPQRFQYEVRTDAKTQSFEAIARGYPLPGGKAVELVLRSRVEGGHMTMTSEVMRRQ